jgi:hypothetical protein
MSMQILIARLNFDIAGNDSGSRKKSNTFKHLEADMSMIRIQALEWVQGRIQDIILDNVTWQVPNPTTKLNLYPVSNAFIFYQLV